MLWAFAAANAPGFNGHVVSSPPLTVVIEEIPVITNRLAPQALSITLSNASAVALPVQVRLHGLVDGGQPEGPDQHLVTVPANGTARTNFQFTTGSNTFSALYPVKVTARFASQGQQQELEAVQVFQTQFLTPAEGASSTGWPVNVVPERGALALATLRTHRISWNYIDQTLQTLPPGWQGSEPMSLAHFSRESLARGETRLCLNMHPPYRPRAGTMFAEYRVQLPKTTPIHLHFFNAIRDSTPQEGASDGVTFRVWAGEEKVFDRHTDSKVWLAGNANLSKFAGKEIRLRLESHPGPKNDTTCDSSFWADPVIISGPAPKTLESGEKNALAAAALRALADPAAAGSGAFGFDLQDGMRAAIVPGPNGLCDAAIAFGAGDKTVVLEGFNVALWDQVAGRAGSAAIVEGADIMREGPGRVRIIHKVRAPQTADHGPLTGKTATELKTEERGEGPVMVAAMIWSEGPGLRVKISSTGRITDLSPGPISAKAAKVYYGHGYCITDPGPFRAGGGGHDLSASHVGFDFENGLSLLTACDQPPDYFQVNPAQNMYALHTHPDATFTFVPGTAGALDCAVRYRPLYDKRPAPALAKKAGRFVFDYWGGRYAENTSWLKRCFDYGLTNSIAVVHVWQRWGYDYRLPDIFPPLASLGTVEELRELGDTCTRAGALWAPHDNYIDIYPDADGFTYDAVTFHADGQPRKAWLNEGRKAQSYQFRPDRVRPFLERNLDLMAPALKPTSSFVDVWTSINAFDYHDREGRFHSKTETLRHWGEAFQLISRTFGNAPTISEAGSDQLIGWLEGADCQFLRISQGRESFTHSVPCGDWERVPWFDAVNHARFSLHGVGYSSRYQGGLPRETHGIQSDDYLSAEILTGHALMVERSCGVRGAVRKYWLAQDFIESIALDDIASADFADGDIHRVHVKWKSGAEVWVNRGTNDWTVSQRVLPPFGCLARNGGMETSIERLGGRIIERSQSGSGSYLNPRPEAGASGVDFGPLKTAGALRLHKSDKSLFVIPLPDSPAFEVTLKLDRLLPASVVNRPAPLKPIKVQAVDSAGVRGEESPVTAAAWQITFTTRKADFGYRIDY